MSARSPCCASPCRIAFQSAAIHRLHQVNPAGTGSRRNLAADIYRKCSSRQGPLLQMRECIVTIPRLFMKIFAALLLLCLSLPAVAEGALTARQADEVRVLVHDVLADAETRSSYLMLPSSRTAGIEQGRVFFSSPDGSHALRLRGFVQTRYVLGKDKEAGPGHYDGFEVRRAKLKFDGHVFGGFGYGLTLAADPSLGNVQVEDVFVTLELSDQLLFRAGHFKLPFAAQELLPGNHQVAVERAPTTDYFTVGRSNAIELGHINDDRTYRTLFAFSEGGAREMSELGDGSFAFTARSDSAFIGDLTDFRDHLAQQDAAMRMGAAMHVAYQDPPGVDHDWVSLATVDLAWKYAGWAMLGAMYGGYDHEDWALGGLLQVDMQIARSNWHVFGRWEGISDNLEGKEDIAWFLTGGINWVVNPQVRITSDVMVALGHNGLPHGWAPGEAEGNAFGSNQGWHTPAPVDVEDNKLVWRTQLQLTF